MEPQLTRSGERELWRIIASVLMLAVFLLLLHFENPINTIGAGEVAGHQFDNSDASAVLSTYGMGFFSHRWLPYFVLFIGLAVIWFRPMRALLPGLVVVAVLGGAMQPASAYYQKTDYAEPVTIYPNETAFWIPDAGANRDSQSKMDSAAFYNDNKVPLKRFLIPHAKLQGSGWAVDYYVPAGRLILVDRSPYNREWAKASHRGTSKDDQSFPCQDNGGHDVTVEMAVGASVSEDNAAKFLARFGIKPVRDAQGNLADRTDPNVIFTSVYYGRSLTEAMDTVGRGEIQTAVCSEISSLGVDDVNLKAKDILERITARAREYLGSYGITVEYLGWAGTFTFSDMVQNAMDRRYVADKDRQIAEALQPYVQTIQALAGADALRAFGKQTDGKLPTTIVGLPTNTAELMAGLLATSKGAAPGTNSGAAPH